MEKRTLITTAVFNKTDKPTIFLGNWCLNNFNYNLWEAMDYEIHQSEIFKCKNSFRLVRDSEKIYESILDDLSIVLNQLNKINWKKQSWRMVIGPCLYRYVSIFHKNIELIKEIKKNPTVIIDEEISINSNIKLETSDLWDFTNQIYNDNLNKDIFSIAISKIFNKEKIYEKFKKLNNQVDLGINKENIKKISFFTILKNYLLKIFERILCFNNKTIFYKIYYGNTFSLLKIFLKLKEVPFKYNFKEERNYFNFESSKRQLLDLKQVDDLNEQIIRDFIKKALPTIYLEGFNKIMERVDSGLFPKRREIIFSCNIQYDYLFKFWAAKQLELGSKLIYGQHGAGPDLFENDPNIEHDCEISDLYLSWGWKHPNKKVYPVGCFSVVGKKNCKKINNKKFLLVLKENCHYFKHNDLFFLDDILHGSKEYVSRSTETVCQFINQSKKNSLNLYVRLHPNDRRHPVPLKNLLEKKFQKINFDKNLDMLKAFNKYEIIIFSTFLHTSFFYSIGLNKPCIVFMTNDLAVVNPKYKKIFTALIKAKVFHTSPESAITFLNNEGKNIQSWWESSSVRKAIELFKDHHVKDDLISDNIFQLLNKEKKSLNEF